MVKKIIYLNALAFLVGIVSVKLSYSGMSCDGTQFKTDHGLVYVPRGTTRTVTINGRPYSCTGCEGCTPISSGGTTGGFTPPSGRLSPSQQMAIGIMGGLFNSIFSNMSNDLFAPPDTSAEDALRKQQEEYIRKQEELKKQTLEQWKQLQKAMEDERLGQEAQRKQAGQTIVSQYGIGEDFKLEPSLFGTTQGKLDAKSIPSTGYPAPKSAIDQALCASYFSEMAKNAKDPENARFLSQQAENVMQGAPTDYPCQLEAMPEVPVPQETYAKNEEVEAFINTYQTKLKEFEDIQTKVTEVRKKKIDAETRLKEVDAKITELQAKAPTVDKPEEKAQLDDLLQQAMSAKQQAENDLNTAKENEQKLLDIAKQKAEEIKGLQEKMSGLQGSSSEANKKQ